MQPIGKTDNLHELIFNYNFSIHCDSLETLLRKGEAEYVLHIECSNTAFRIALKNSAPHIEYRLPKARVNGEINMVAMIVAKVDIDRYVSADLNEDYIGEVISLKKGAILAYQNLPAVYVNKKNEELANNDSFFTVIKRVSLDPNEIRPLSFNLYDHRIKIYVDEKTYEAFVRYQQSQSIAIAMLVLPALTYMVYDVMDNTDRFEQYSWFQRLKAFYRSKGKDFVGDILSSGDNPVDIAQEMLQNPIGNAYRELYALEG